MNTRNLRCVTFTGADDTVSPNMLYVTWGLYPGVEWGILVSKSVEGKRRFPTRAWVSELCRVKYNNPDLPLSLHVCGRWLRDFMMGIVDPYLEELFPYFDRVQLNFHGNGHSHLAKVFDYMERWPGIEWIFQYDSWNYPTLQSAYEKGIKHSALFDMSHGAGVLPDQWPKPLKNSPCGYAGGLGPDNVVEQYLSIQKTVGPDYKFWIDMETKVRGDVEQAKDVFDMKKVMTVLRHIYGPA